MIKNYLTGLLVFGIIFGGIFYFYKQTTGPLADQSVNPPTSSAGPSFSLAEVATHKNISNCWTIINGKVYNITAFIPLHPGGSVIARICGKDGTRLFNSVDIHQSQNAPAILEQYYIGNLSS